jgi:hypothetical protein
MRSKPELRATLAEQIGLNYLLAVTFALRRRGSRRTQKSARERWRTRVV